MIRRGLYILAALFFAFINVTSAKALSSDFYAENNILFYDEHGSPAACNGSGSVLQGNDNIEKAFRYFIDPARGLTGAQSAGIVGNLMQESGVNPLSVNKSSGATGIAQWLGGRLTTLKAKANWQDISVQLDYLWQELNTTEKGTLDALKTASTPGEAAVQFEAKFERSGGSAVDKRVANANAVFVKYGGSGSVSTDTSTTAPVTLIDSCSGSGNFATNFVEYKQCNYGGKTVPWANAPYGNSTVCAAGCGPSAMAMIITNMTGQQVTPDISAKYGAEHGTAAGGGEEGSNWNLPQVVGGNWGLKSKEIGPNIIAINQALQGGALILTTGRGPDPYTSGGHFVVIRAVTADGKWLTGNSAGFDSSKPYDPQQVVTYMRNAWALTK